MTPSLCLLAAGSNARGQLASRSNDDSYVFKGCHFTGSRTECTLPPGTNKILQLVTGANHTLVLLEYDGGKRELWGSGDGHKGQLGPEYAGQLIEFNPINMPLSRDFASQGYTCCLIAAAWETSYLVFRSPPRPDILVSMGSNDFAALGVGINQTTSGPTVVSFDHLIIEGRPITSGGLVIESITAGPRHVILHVRTVLNDGYMLIGWGSARHGQLGSTGKANFDRPHIITLDVTADPVQTYSVGLQHTVVYHQSGRTTAFGSNTKGQIHSLDSLGLVQQVGCTWNGTYLLMKGDENILLSTGSNSHGQLGRVSHTADGGIAVGPVEFISSHDGKTVSSSVRSFACGSEHVISTVTPAGSLDVEIWGWGWNEHGNLGLSHTDDVPKPVKIWPAEGYELGGRIVEIWAGNGTSWILIQL